MKFWYIRYPFSCCLRNWAPERSILSKHILLPFLYATGDNCTCHLLSIRAAGTSTLKSMAILPARSATFLLLRQSARQQAIRSGFPRHYHPFIFREALLQLPHRLPAIYLRSVDHSRLYPLLLGLRCICVSPTRWAPFFSKTETMGVLQLSTSVERVPNRNSLLYQSFSNALVIQS